MNQPADEQAARWVCPVCGSEDIECLAWIRLNGEEIVSYDECSNHWCPVCEAHYKAICLVDHAGRCLMHDQPYSKCRAR